MRRHGTIRPLSRRFESIVGGIAFALMSVMLWPGPRACAQGADAESTAAVEVAPAWLPLPAEEIEAPERLSEPALAGNAAIRADVSGGRWNGSRFVARVRTRSLAAAAARIESRDGGARSTIAVSAFGEKARLGAGRLAIRDAAVLFGEAIGFSRRLRRPLTPRSSAPEWEAPQGAASPAIDGVAIGVASGRESRSRAAWTLWALGGRGGDDAEPLVAGGLAHRARQWEAAASVGRRYRSLAAAWLGNRGRVAFEALLTPAQGPAFLASATADTPAAPFRFGAAWRRRSGERRPVAAEFSAEAGTRHAATARITWRPWSASGSAFADDGAVELDARWRAPGAPGAARLRLGRRGGEGTAAARALLGIGANEPVASMPERYAILDLPLAGESGRLVSLLASRRERSGAAARVIGTTVGARTRLSWRGRASVTAQVDAARTDGAESGHGVAWSSAIAPSGEETLAERGSNGVTVTVSGQIRAGPIALRVHARDGDGERRARPLAATIWMEWSGSAKRFRPTGDAGSGG